MSETGTKDFHIGDILSAATGVLVSPNGVGGVYEILNWMSGENVYTHQLPRISREASPVILAAHPQLASAYEESKQVTPDNYQEWLKTWVDRYGETLPVPKFNLDQHERIDPLSELAEKVDPDKIIVAQT